MNEETVLENACLLAMLRKHPNETIIDIQVKLVNTGMFNLIESKRIFLILIKQKKYIAPQFDQLTIHGFIKAKEVEKEFKQK